MRLADRYPRLGRAWQERRAEQWRLAEQLAPRLRQPSETHLEATRRIYLTAMKFHRNQ